MMTQIKYALSFLYGGLFTATSIALLYAWPTQDVKAISALVAALFLMTLFIASFVVRFFVVYWRKR